MTKLKIDKTEYLKHYNNGLNDSQISKILNCYQQKISRFRKSLNLPVVKHPIGHFSNITKEQYLECYNNFMSDSQIAKKYNTCRKALSKLRNSLNLPETYKSMKYRKIISNLVEKGYSDKYISTQIPISKSNIQYIRKRMGLKTNFIERTYLNKTDRRKGKIIGNLKHSAKRRGLEFNLEYTDLELPKYCPILKVELQYGYNSNNLFNASVDRIDNSKGYIKGNIIIISRLANLMKNQANFKQLQLFINNQQKILNYYKNHGTLGSITDIFPNTEMYIET